MKAVVSEVDDVTLAAIRSIQNRFGSPKYIESNERVTKFVESYRFMNPEKKILLVLGTFDLIHIGHARYLQRCRESADIVVVIVDPDAAVRLSKGKNEDRPVVPEWERLEMLAHLEWVDHVLFMEEGDFNPTSGLWLRKPPFRPDVMVISKRTPCDEEHENACREICGTLIVLESQATTSTTGKIRLLILNSLQRAKDKILGVVTDTFEDLRGGDGG